MSNASTSAEENGPLPQDKILHLLQDCSNNLRHAKAQQWQAGYLTLVAYGALVTAAYQVVGPCRPLSAAWPITLAVIWSVLIFAAGAIGVWMVWDLQRWMARLRESMTEAEKHCPDEYRRIAGTSCRGNNYHSVSVCFRRN